MTDPAIPYAELAAIAAGSRAAGIEQEARDVAAYLVERRADLMALTAKRRLSAGEADLVGRMLDALASSFAAGVHRTGGEREK